MNPFPVDADRGESPENDARATLIAGSAEGLAGELWMGGANAALGIPLDELDLTGAVLVDCAGELSPRLRRAGARVVPFVFPDLEAVPQRYPRLLALADELARLLRGGGARTPASDPTAPQGGSRLIVLCQQGMNRSALVSGLTLRAAGLDAPATMTLLRSGRPGCLTNQTFAALIEGTLDRDAGEVWQ
jgi:hypothetical protein